VNASATVQLPGALLQFKSSGTNWKARLQSFTQPIPLKTEYLDSGFVINIQNEQGVTEGPAQIILSNGNQHFYFPVLLRNRQTTAAPKDYRSPKTVNPDSSLQQQSIRHQVDASRNILISGNQYFKEEEITLAPKAGTSRAMANVPLSAYYVQPGSCVAISVKSQYSKENNLFTVTAGPLKDKYNNKVADGTLVAFIYGDNEQTWRMEAALLDGEATVFIPAANKKYSLHVKVNETVSGTILLTP